MGRSSGLLERTRWIFVTLVAVAVVSLPARARADSSSPAEPIAITYSATDACPSEEQFLALVRRYTTKWTKDAPSSVRTFAIRIEPRGETLDGSLLITTPDGTATSRAIAGSDCETVARTLAVVVALAIDPTARFGGPTAETEPEPASPVPAKPPDVSLAPARPPERRPPPPEPRRWTYAFEGRVEITSAVVEGALPVVGAAFETRLRLGESTWLWPSLALGVRQSFLREIDAPVGSSEFLWTAGTVRLCPVRLLAGRFDLAPCVELDVGVLQAAARGVAEARTTVTPWFDRGLCLRAAYGVSKGWGLGLSTLVTAPTSRKRFTFETGDLISQAPRVGVTVGLLVELRR